MIELLDEVELDVPVSDVWRALQDPGLVAACMPGASIDGEGPAGTYQGRITFKFGPTVAVFRGEATLRYDEAARACAIEGRGTDQRGASRAMASFLVTAEGTGTTRLRLRGGFKVSGPLEAFANAGGVAVARAMLASFAANLAALLTRAGEPSAAGNGDAEEESSIAHRPPPAPSGFAMLWKALRLWVDSAFRRAARPVNPPGH